jgi:uracil phosphoribosyltransferase
MRVINLSEQNSVLNQYLREIRDSQIQQDSMRFRRNIERIGEVMAIELSKQLDYVPTDVQTPLGIATVNTIAAPLVLTTILRAGLPMYQGFLNIFDKAENAFLSAYRRVVKDAQGKEQLEIVAEYMAAPAIEGKTLIIADPMLATGGSASAAITNIKKRGAKKIMLVCLVGVPEGVKRIEEDHPDVDITLAALDDHLNEKGYIVPGLGDAGDRLFGTA